MNRYLFVVWIQNPACSLEGIIPSHKDTCHIMNELNQFHNFTTSSAAETKEIGQSMKHSPNVEYYYLHSKIRNTF